MRVGVTASAWLEQASRDFKTPSAAETDASQTHECLQSPWVLHELLRQSRFTISLPRNRAFAILEKSDEARNDVDRKGLRNKSRHGHPADHDGASASLGLARETRGRQPTTPSMPPPATKSHLQVDSTPRDAGTWAAENRGGRMLGQAYQQTQCAGNPCSTKAHVRAMVVHGSGHAAA